MENMQLGAAAAAPQGAGRGPRPRRLLQARGADDLGPLGVTVSFSACVTALMAPAYTPAVVFTVLFGVLTLFTGVWVSTLGRGRHGIGFVNLCCAFLVLFVAVAQGCDFSPKLLEKLCDAFAN